MRVKVRVFARLRDIVGEGELDRDVPAGTTAQGVWDILAREYPELTRYQAVVSCAVREEYSPLTTVLEDGDEVAFLPPVSGGESRYVSTPNRQLPNS